MPALRPHATGAIYEGAVTKFWRQLSDAFRERKREGLDRVSLSELLAPPPENGNLAPGTLLANGKYRIENVLGQGGFGITYAAHDVRLDRRVAIKEFFPTQLAHRASGSSSLKPHSDRHSALFADGLEGFIDEARILHDLNHPNVVNVRDYLEENGTGYIVMNYYEGRTLASEIKEAGGRLPWETALSLMRGVLDGLDAAHASGIVHRDVKPQNIYITTNGRAVLLDFGAARYALGEQTHTHTTILTRGFAPLEQYDASKGSQGPWTDVYASSATLYFAITGAEPPEAIARLDKDALKPLASFDRSIPSRLSAAIMRGLSVHRRDRPQTIEALRNLLFSSNGLPRWVWTAIGAAAAIAVAITVTSFVRTGKKTISSQGSAPFSAAKQIGADVAKAKPEDVGETVGKTASPVPRAKPASVDRDPIRSGDRRALKNADKVSSTIAAAQTSQAPIEPSSREMTRVLGPMNSGITQATVFAEYGAAQDKYKLAMSELRSLMQRYPKSERLPLLKDSLDNLVARAR